MNINKERTNLDFFYNKKALPDIYDKSIVFTPTKEARDSGILEVNYNGFYRPSPEPKAYIYSLDGTQLVEAQCLVTEYDQEVSSGLDYDSTTTNIKVVIPDGFEEAEYNVILALDTSNILTRDTLSLWSDAFESIDKLDSRYEDNLRGLSFSDYYAKPSRLDIEEIHRIDYTNPNVTVKLETLRSTIDESCVGSSNLEILNIEKWPTTLTEVPFLFARSKIRYMSIPLDLTKILDLTALFANSSNNTAWLEDTSNYFEFPSNINSFRPVSMMAIYANTGLTALKDFNLSQVKYQIKLLSIFEGTSLGGSKTSLTNVKFGTQTDLERVFAQPTTKFVDGWVLPIDFITTQSNLNLTFTFMNSGCTVSPFCGYLIKSLRPLSLYGTFYGSAFKLESISNVVSRTNFSSISTDRCLSTAYFMGRSNCTPIDLGIEDFDMSTVINCEGMFIGTYAADFTFKPGNAMINSSYVFSNIKGEATVYGYSKNPKTTSVTLDLTDAPNIETLYAAFNSVYGAYFKGYEGGVNATIIYNKDPNTTYDVGYLCYNARLSDLIQLNVYEGSQYFHNIEAMFYGANINFRRKMSEADFFGLSYPETESTSFAFARGTYTFLPDTQEFTYKFGAPKAITLGAMFSNTRVVGVGTNSRFEFTDINLVRTITQMFRETSFVDGTLTVNIDASLDKDNNTVGAVIDFELANTSYAFEYTNDSEPSNIYIDTIRFPGAYVRTGVAMFKGSNIDSNSVLDFRCASRSGTLSVDVSSMFQDAKLLTVNESIGELFSTAQLSTKVSASSYLFDNMFNGATNAMVDCSLWCVTQIDGEPVDFALGTKMPNEYIPVWGTCPLYYARPTSNMTAINFDTTGRNTIDERTVTITPAGYETMETTDISVIGLSGQYVRVDLPVTLDFNSASFVVPEGYNGSIGVIVTHKDGSNHGGIKIESSTESSALTGFQQFSDKLNNIRIGNAAPIYSVPETLPSSFTSMEEMFAGEGIISNNALKDWNTGNITDMSQCFRDNTSLISNSLNGWDISRVTKMSSMFQNSTVCDSQNFSNWNTSSLNDTSYMFQDAVSFNASLVNLKFGNVSDATGMFNGATSFNQPVGNWDTSKLISATYMFYGATSFNQDISKWNTSSVKYMNYMFYNAQAFNSDVSSWSTANVTTMDSMFCKASTFNKPVNSWNVSKVVSMSNMFAYTSFNQPISSWSTTSLTNVVGMFMETSQFNQPIETLNLSRVNSTESMFKNALSFNQSIANLILDKVINMKDMFNGAAKFNGNIEGISTSNVINMVNMFANTASFNKTLERLDTGKVVHFTGMFQNAKNFNQPLLGWDVKSATNMDNMFNGAAVFNKNIAGWCVSKITSAPENFSSSISSSYVPVWGTCPVAKRTVIELNSNNMIGTDTTTEDSRTIVITPSVDSTIKVLFATRDTRFMQAVPASTTIENGFVFPVNYTGLISVEVTPTTGTVVPSLQFSRPSANAATNFVKDISQLSSTVTNTRFTFKDDFKVTASLPTTMTDLSNMFSGCTSFNHDISSWVTSNVTTMSRMFSGCTLFNQPIGAGNWTTPKVTNMAYMFNGCSAFNKPISRWSLSNVTSLEGMFYNAAVFNSAIPTSTSKVTNMSYMFYKALEFNQPVEGMNTSSVTTMTSMFYGDRMFNQPVNGWNVSKVTSMREMFRDTFVFDKPLTSWDTSSVRSMTHMFYGARKFNQPLGHLNTPLVTTMQSMFESALLFNNTIPLNTPNLQDISSCFKNAPLFNQDINELDVSNVYKMQYAFNGATSFNSPLDKWDTGSVLYMDSMFEGATLFEQDISKWCVPNFTEMPVLFTTSESKLPSAYYPVWGTCPAAKVASHEFEIEIDTTQYTSPVEITLACSSLDVWEKVTAKYGSNGQSITDYTVSGRFITIPIKAGYSGRLSLGLKTEDGALLRLSALLRDTTAYDFIKEVFKFPENSRNVRLNIPDDFKLSATLPKNVNSCAYMFHNAYNFNGSLEGLDVSNVTNMESMFYDATKFNGLLTGWNTSKVTNMSDMFLRATSFNKPLNHFDTSKVTAFTQMFGNASAFNQDISSFSFASAETIASMFSSATAFNKEIGTWDVSNVTNFYGVFSGATSFNQVISEWNVTNATNMGSMFYNASSFNKSIGLWNVRNVENMDRMFSGAKSFNQDITTWCVSNITELPYEFKVSSSLADLYTPVWGTCPFVLERHMGEIVLKASNKNTYSELITISGNIGQVVAMSESDGSITTLSPDSYSRYSVPALFDGHILVYGAKEIPRITIRTSVITEIMSFSDTAVGVKLTLGSYNIPLPSRLGKSMTTLEEILLNSSEFNQDISGWDTSKITSLKRAFRGCAVFNQDISGWDVSNVTDMSETFAGAYKFNKPLNEWDTSKVTTMNTMFRDAYMFNQPLDKWDTSKVTDMSSMFFKATEFNKPLNTFNTSNVTDMSSMFREAYVFNSSVAGWDTSNVAYTTSMFSRAYEFNQPLTGWNLNNVLDAASMFYNAQNFNSSVEGIGFERCQDMSSIFYNCYVFDKPLVSWNTKDLRYFSSALANCTAFNQPMDSFNFSSISDLTGVFENCTSFNVSLANIDLGQASSVASMLSGCTSFNGSVNNWNMPKCTNFSNLFYGCAAFDQPLVGWDTSSLSNSKSMFSGCKVFNSSLGGLDVKSSVDLTEMFKDCKLFNQPVTNLTTAEALYFNGMFNGCTSFNQPVDALVVSRAVSFNSMFKGCTSFNQPVSSFKNAASVSSFDSMFSGCTSFNSDVYELVKASAKVLSNMFRGCTSFNQDLNSWDVSSVSDMTGMFYGATKFNGDIGKWRFSESSSLLLTSMFEGATAFNKDISDWNVNRSSLNMTFMFCKATSFNQPIGKWALTGNPSVGYFLDGATSFSQDLSSWNITPGTYFNRNGIMTEDQLPSKK